MLLWHLGHVHAVYSVDLRCASRVFDGATTWWPLLAGELRYSRSPLSLSQGISTTLFAVLHESLNLFSFSLNGSLVRDAPHFHIRFVNSQGSVD